MVPKLSKCNKTLEITSYESHVRSPSRNDRSEFAQIWVAVVWPSQPVHPLQEWQTANKVLLCQRLVYKYEPTKKYIKKEGVFDFFGYDSLVI